MDDQSMARGWHILRGGSPSGPFTWEDLHKLARAGELAPDDLVWHATLTDWVAAKTVPGLIPPGTFEPRPLVASPVESPPRSRLPLIAGIAGLLVIAALAVAAFAFLGSGEDGASADDTAADGAGELLGMSSYSAPSTADIVESPEWGRLPVNQLGLVLKEGFSRDDADRLAQDLGASIVGEMEFLNLFQLQVPASSEQELFALIERASADEAVELAFPNQEALPDEEIWGVRVSPLNDPVYEGENAKPYEMIGVERAWNLIRGLKPELAEVQVGVVDDGLFKEQGEFAGKTALDEGEEGDDLSQAKTDKDGNPRPYGSHGTAVAGIIAADPDNGGQTGVASILGEKLKLGMTNIWGPKYGEHVPVEADPNDVTQMEFANGTYALGDLLGIKAQISRGATIINCSWGNSNAHPAVAATYKKFFQKMAEEHPDVLFVCSAGNDGRSLDGTKRFPSGLALPNMITVGCLENDGSRVEYSNTKSDNFEVTLAAPGHRVVSGVGPNGEVSNINGGTSFATPQVTAAAALIRSLNPELSAGEIKEILTQTAGPGVTDASGEFSVPFPHDELGAGVLRVDQAVLKVINDLRAEKGEAPYALEELENLGVIDAVAVSTDVPMDYLIRGIVKGLRDQGTDVSISLSGQGAIGGSTTQRLDSPGEVSWTVTLADEWNQVTVRRGDNGAASVITIEALDLNGHWTGTFTFGTIDVPPDVAGELEEQGCDLSILKMLEGETVPMTLDLTADPGGTGTATVFIDVSAALADAEPEPFTGSVQWSGNSVTITAADSGGSGTLQGQASRQGDSLVLTGSYTASASGLTVPGTWTVSKPAE
ncbi:MAG: hypothetical protein Kow00129_15350 [Thermoleophilia bacterium]